MVEKLVAAVKKNSRWYGQKISRGGRKISRGADFYPFVSGIHKRILKHWLTMRMSNLSSFLSDDHMIVGIGKYNLRKPLHFRV